MRALSELVRDKPFIIAISALIFIPQAHDLTEAFHQAKDRRFDTHQFPLPHLPSWYKMYRSHHKANIFLKLLITGFSAYTPKQIEFGEDIFEGFGRLNEMSPDDKQALQAEITLEDFQESVKDWQDILAAMIADYESELSEPPLEPAVKDAAVRLFAENGLACSFFMLVVAPCWLLYRTSPTKLYRQARRGDIQALDKLLRLDALMIHDPAIGQQIQSLRFRGKNAPYEKLLTASLKRPRTKITTQKLKFTIAGYLSAVATAIKFPINEPTMRALFDAYTLDKYGLDIDTDLPDGQEALRKVIERERKMWLKMLLPDKKK